MNNATRTNTFISDVGQAMADGRWGDVLAHLAPDVIAHVPAV